MPVLVSPAADYTCDIKEVKAAAVEEVMLNITTSFGSTATMSVLVSPAADSTCDIKCDESKDAAIEAAPRVDSPVHELVSLGPARVDAVRHEAGRQFGLRADVLVLRARRFEPDALFKA